jgi:aryl-alcohol dehydrogenase-like predicted oxidoreductase
MRYSLLGKSGLRAVAAVPRGDDLAEDFDHGARADEARRIVDTYADAGGNVIDTPSNYRDGAP